jgi:hypothetical protein
MNDDLPDDLARPRRRYASDIASLITGLVLLGIVAALATFWMSVPR